MENILTHLLSQSDLFLFTHIGFWIFFCIVLLLSSLFQKKRILRISFLTLASLYFYYKTGGYFFSLLLISTLTDYTIGILLNKFHNQWQRKLLVALSLFINLSILAYFKYTYFVIDIYSSVSHTEIEAFDYLANLMNQSFGSSFSIDTIALPVGISFFTFQTISYTIDVYRKELKPVRNIIDFGFYVSFFPQLIAGPIVRAKTFIPQIYRTLNLSEKWIWWAILLILGGLFKKMVISDFISTNLIDRVFEHPISYSGFEVIISIYAYALQIYCDFSGYTDIALGAALLLGFRLPKNFNHPYKATSLSDFWRRWHISLSTWLRDYLYIPLGGNQNGKIRTYINLLITMLIGGLWHGAALKYIIWGGLHGLGLIVNRLIKHISKESSQVSRVVGWILTFHFVVITWVVFRVESLQNAQIMIDRVIRTFMPINIINIISSQPYLFALLIIGFTIHWIPDTFRRNIKLRFVKSPVWLKILISALFLYCIYLLNQNTIIPFIYFRF